VPHGDGKMNNGEAKKKKVGKGWVLVARRNGKKKNPEERLSN